MSATEVLETSFYLARSRQPCPTDKQPVVVRSDSYIGRTYLISDGIANRPLCIPVDSRHSELENVIYSAFVVGVFVGIELRPRFLLLRASGRLFWFGNVLSKLVTVDKNPKSEVRFTDDRFEVQQSFKERYWRL